MLNPLVSVIVPVYNIRDYLEQCLDSLVIQTLEDIEFILIEDGSTDGSGELCDKYAEVDHRFRVFHKPNEGLAAARNDGVSLARSEYIMFVDGDDWVEPDFCEQPYRVAVDNNADIVCFRHIRFSDTTEEKKPPFPVGGIVDKDDVLTRYWEFAYATSMNKLYKKCLFDGIEYPVGRYSEDIAVAHKLIYKSERIYFLNSYLYHYRTNRPGSICNSGTLKHKEDHMYFTFRMMEDLRNWGYNVEEDETRYAMSYLLVIGRRGESSDYCDKVLKKSNTGFLNWKMRTMFNIYRISPALFDIIAVATGKRFKEKAHSG